MSIHPNLEAITSATIALIGQPFQWCPIPGGSVHLEDASGPNDDLMRHKGTAGGTYQIANCAMAKYPITNAQYQRFIDAPTGHANSAWWDYAAATRQFHKDRPKPHPTAFAGPNLPRSRVSWFDSMAFCAWLSAQLEARDEIETGHQFKIEAIDTWCVRLPTEQEWQRAAVGDSGWPYPWGNKLEQTRANYGDHIRRTTAVDQYPDGQSPYGVMDMVGNLAEWLLTRWGEDSVDVNGYSYRGTRGSAWNVATPELFGRRKFEKSAQVFGAEKKSAEICAHLRNPRNPRSILVGLRQRFVRYLRAIDRNGWSPRGRLNDAGFRCAYITSRRK